jgi:hypothetical protein
MIQRILNSEEASYSSSLDAENLKKRIKILFEQKSLRLAGKLISENEFTACDNLVVVGWSMPNLRRRSAYLVGKITQAQDGTLIKLKVNPNTALPVFAILATLCGFIFTILGLTISQDDQTLLILGLAFIVVGAAYYPISTLLRNRLRNKIVRYLELDKV